MREAQKHRLSGPLGLADHCRRHDIARREIAASVVARHERLALGIDQSPALPPNRFRDEKTRYPGHVQDRRVKLDELEIADAGAGAPRHGEAIAGGNGRIGRLAKHLPGATGRHEDVGRPHLGAPPGLVERHHAPAAAALHDEVERAVVLGTTDLILAEDLPEVMLERDVNVANLNSYHGAVAQAKKQIILNAMEQTAGNFNDAAKLLGVHPTYLQRLVGNLNLREQLKR